MSVRQAFNSIAGKLLISRIPLEDSINDVFHHSVILIVQADDRAVYGVDLTHPLDDGIFAGGPVKHVTALLHWKREFPAIDGIPCVNYMSSFNNIAFNKPEGRITPDKLIFGCADWSPDQLNEEIDAGYWHVMNAEEDLIFKVEARRLYETCCQRAGIALTH